MYPVIEFHFRGHRSHHILLAGIFLSLYILRGIDWPLINTYLWQYRAIQTKALDS